MKFIRDTMCMIVTLTFLLNLSMDKSFANPTEIIESKGKVTVDLKFYKKNFDIPNSDFTATGAVAFFGIGGGLLVLSLAGGPATLIIAAGAVALTGATDAVLQMEEKENKRSIKIKTSLISKEWSPGKIRGVINLKGKKKCADVAINFEGLETSNGDYALYAADPLKTEPFALLTNYGSTQTATLTKDVTYISTGRKSTSCSMKILKNASLVFES